MHIQMNCTLYTQLDTNIIGRIHARACAFAKSVNQPLTSAGVCAEERRQYSSRDHHEQEPGSGPGWIRTGKTRRKGGQFTSGGGSLLRSQVSGGTLYYGGSFTS